MVYQGVIATRSNLAPLLLIMAVFGSALTLASFVKVIHSVFLGRMPDATAERQPREAPFLMVVPMLFLALLCIVFGVAVRWPVGTWLAPAVSEVAPQLLPPGQEVTYALGAWASSQATVLLIVGLVLGLVFYAIGQVGRVPGTTFYETVRQLPLLRGMYRDADEEAYDVYHLGGRYGSTVVNSLRRLHTGVLAVYVAWCAIGLAIVLLYLLPLG